MRIYKVTLPVSLAFVLISITAEHANAQFIVTDVIKAVATKVIKAIDLKVQRMQNQTIWLQNAQKVLENQLSKLRLGDISDWSEKQRQLYSNYYTELWQVKGYITYYQRIKDLTAKQFALVREYQTAWSELKGKGYFQPRELSYMQQVYSGILDASMKNLDQVMLVVSKEKTQLSDGERLEMINQAGDKLDENYNDLRQFNEQNRQFSLARSLEFNETRTLKTLYGIH